MLVRRGFTATRPERRGFRGGEFGNVRLGASLRYVPPRSLLAGYRLKAEHAGTRTGFFLAALSPTPATRP